MTAVDGRPYLRPSDCHCNATYGQSHARACPMFGQSEDIEAAYEDVYGPEYAELATYQKEGR